ncbi:MAG: sugar phosphate isomerase/epimerase [Acidimicrobiia bacterium]|nr:sugar phosphate isomerase/epimerase [Acidimicrobiia bacterium]
MKDRFGFNAANKPLETHIAWAAANGFGYIDFAADVPPNDIRSFDAARSRRIRALCEKHAVQIGIHTTSAVNGAEYVPILAEAVDRYLLASLDLAQRIGCGWVIIHGGYQFGDIEARRKAAVERVKRITREAERRHATLFFENHNKEPEHSEIRYLPHHVEEMRWFLDEISSPSLKWAFNAAHAHLVPEGWKGFLDAFGVSRIGQVRLNDNKGDYEIHLVPGEGNIDFPALFSDLRARGYKGWFSLGFGTDADKIRVRDWFAKLV